MQELQALSTSAREKVDAGDPEGALVPYTKLQSLSQGLKIRHKATEEAAVHLVEYVESTVGGLWKDMKKRLSTELEEVLKQLEWPKEQVNMAGKEKAFRQAFEKLFVLQGPELEQHKDVVLVPFQVLVRPLALRFRYHFEGQRQTNRVDKVCLITKTGRGRRIGQC